ncbi:MAG: DUF3006 domain-containing protein [Bacillota bacterium]|nr:DUF3006 domain-containing protein [Bacillota bacterium]
MKQYCIDRFEGSWALCEQEDGHIISIPRAQLPAEAEEGDFLQETETGFRLDPEAKAVAGQKNTQLLQSLFSPEKEQ